MLLCAFYCTKEGSVLMSAVPVAFDGPIFTFIVHEGWPMADGSLVELYLCSSGHILMYCVLIAIQSSLWQMCNAVPQYLLFVVNSSN